MLTPSITSAVEGTEAWPPRLHSTDQDPQHGRVPGASPAFVVPAADDAGVYGAQQQRRATLMIVYSEVETDFQ